MLPPALLDPGPPNAQVSTSLSFDIFVSQPKHSEEGLSHSHSSQTMYPSSLGENFSRFSNSSEENPSLSFDSPALPRSSSGLSKPRLNKVRKQLSSQNLRFAGVSERGVGQGFNPFRPEPYRFESEPGSGSNAFVFRTSSDDLGSSVAEEMMNLKIGSENEFVNKTNDGFVFGSKGRSVGVDEMKLEGDMRKLKIGGVGYGKSGESGRAEFVFRSGDNVGGLDGKGVESGLENEFKMKLSVKDGGKDDGSGVVFGADDGRKFVFDGSKKSGDSAAATELHDQMKNLNLTNKNEVVFDVDEEERLVLGSSHRSGDSLGANELRDQMKNLNSTNRNEMDDTMKEKDGFGFGKDKGSGMNLVGERENVLSNEMERKLNIGSITSDSTGEAGVGRFSSQNFAKDNQTGNVDDKKFDNFDESVPMGFTSKAAMQSRDESGSQIFVEQRNDGARLSEMGSSSSSFSSSGAHFQSVDNSSTVLGMDGPDKRHEFRFASSQDVVGTPFVEFKTPNSKANLFSGVSQNLEFAAKRDFVGDTKLKKRRGKLRQANPVQLRHGQDFVSTGSVSQENPEPSESYSPMDVSPYHETLVGTLCSRETSVASDESLILDSNDASNDSQTMVSNVAMDQDLVAATQHMDINEEYAGSRETEEGHSERGVAVVRPPEESISGAETESFKSANEEIDFNFDSSVNSVETEAGSSSNVNRQDIDCGRQFSFPSHSEEKSGSNFTFAAASTASAGSAGQSHLSASKRQHKKKNSVKIGHDSFTSTSKSKVPRAPASLQFSAFSGPSQLLSAQQSEKGEQFSPRLKVGHKTEVDRGQEIKQEPDLTSAASIAAQEACEKWRLRGNQAYTNGHLSKAEDCYTQGINSVSKGETSRSCLRALMLCYSNRAATRMSLGRMRDALADCMSAVAIDPNFLRVQVRAGNCYLALGEIEDASLYFRKCLQSGSDICVDRKIAVDASDGLQKAQKVSECMQRAAELLQNKISNNADNADIALGVIDEALNISSYSESLLEMKAEALFMLQKYEEVIQLCEQTIDSAEKNSSSLDVDGQLANLDGHEPSRDFTLRLWRCHLIFKSHFYLGRLEEAIASLEKLELSNGGKTLESSIPLAATVRKLLRHKAAGNEAFQAGRHSEAVEHYTVALSCTVESRSFAAICFCNRAAAYKALGHITEAIADCSVAIALDGNYLKAISRRATLYEMIRDYGDAASDLQRLIALLTKLVEKTNQSGASDRSTNWVNDLRQARLRLSAVEEAARKDIPLDMYLILGVERSALTADIKKAYRKAALRYHPDKAGQSLVRSDYGDDRLWKEIGAEVHKDADRLFKMIGEAYAVLSNPDKRLRYDLEEDNRNAQKKRNGSNTPGAQHDAQNCPFDRSSSRRQWREVWRSYGDSPTKWSEQTRPTRFS